MCSYDKAWTSVHVEFVLLLLVLLLVVFVVVFTGAVLVQVLLL